MRSFVLLAVALAASGCRGPCGGCARFETCEPMAVACTLNSGATFDVVADHGEVSTTGRDFFTDGVPNPELCIDFGGGQQCSGERTQTYSPTWNTPLLSGVPAAALIARPIGVSYIDRGLFHDVDICSASIEITEQYLHDGAFRLNCNNGSYAQLALRNVDAGTRPAVDGGGGTRPAVDGGGGD